MCSLMHAVKDDITERGDVKYMLLVLDDYSRRGFTLNQACLAIRCTFYKYLPGGKELKKWGA